MRIKTILLVYFALAACWFYLAQTMEQRHQFIDQKLRHDVAGLWGSEQTVPGVKLGEKRAVESADVQVDLQLNHRKKGHYWYTTYTSLFEGVYLFDREGSKGETVTIPLPSGGGMLSDFTLTLDGRVVEQYSQEEGRILLKLPSTGARELKVTHTSQGCDEWWYDFQDTNCLPRDLNLTITTDFTGFNFPDGSVSPTKTESVDGGYRLHWSYDKLFSGAAVGLELPDKQNPGPVMIDICRYGPLGLLLFFAALTLFSVESGLRTHPVHFILLGAAYFTFHLLLVYLGDVVKLGPALAIAAAVSITLSLAYGWKVFGPNFSLRRVLPALVLYLVLFSCAFLVEGFKGLPLIGILVVTLHLVMQLSAKVDWSELENREYRAKSCDGDSCH